VDTERHLGESANAENVIELRADVEAKEIENKAVQQKHKIRRDAPSHQKTNGRAGGQKRNGKTKER
jgi:hypothetical protein